jgi:glycosyltransferase involved in cell wall biosynthesis
MKVLHINPYPPEHLGGSEIFCKNLTINLQKRKNIECDILTSDFFKNNININYLDENVRVMYKKCYFNLWGKNPITNVFSFIKKNYNKYNIIHTHSYIFFTTTQCAIFRKLRNFPLVLHIHGGIQTPNIIRSSLSEAFQLYFKRYFFDKTIGKYTIESADAIISVSSKDLSFISSKYDISEKKRYYIPNGVDIFKFRKKSNIEKKFITFIGRLSYIKGIDIFIKIIRRLYEKNKDLHFLIVGDGTLRNIVKKAKKNLPITHLTHYPYEKIEDIYNNSKILLLPSRFEGLPTVLLESLACETPVAASNVGGISEVIFSNKNGLLFNIEKHDKSIEMILDLLNNDSKLKEFGENGRNLIKRKFSWEVITDKIENVYKNLI